MLDRKAVDPGFAFCISAAAEHAIASARYAVFSSRAFLSPVLACGRRQIQLQSTASLGALPMAQKIMQREGIAGFYRGFLPNALKNLPNKGMLSAILHCSYRSVKGV